MTTDSEYEREINEWRLGFREDPIGFYTKVLDVKPGHIWFKMREVCESVRDHQFTAVPAGHSVSKTYSAGRLAVWFKTCFEPSTVITTAPSDNQVRNQLWREIHMAVAGSKVPLGGKLTTLQWDLRPSESTLKLLDPSERGLWEKNFAIGFSTSPDSATDHVTKMAGWHNEWILIILDEAGGIMPQIWKTALEALVINERCKVLAIGNPTDPYSKFADVCKSPRWNVIPISIRDTPNYVQDCEVVPGLAGRAFETMILEEYGENSNEHKIRCLGQFPTYSAGTIWGPEIGEFESEGHFGDYPWDRTRPVYVFGDYGNIYTAMGFFQFIRGTIRMVDYFYDDVGMGVPGICKMLESKPYIYPKDQGLWLSPDYDPKSGSNRKSLATGSTILSEFSKLGFYFSVCEKHSFDDGIKNMRGVFPLVRMDVRCSDFWDAVKQYKFKMNLQFSTPGKPAYSKNPQEGPQNHPADMFRYMGWVYRWQLQISGERVGYPDPISCSSYEDSYYDDSNPINYAGYGENPINYR